MSYTKINANRSRPVNFVKKWLVAFSSKNVHVSNLARVEESIDNYLTKP